MRSVVSASSDSASSVTSPAPNSSSPSYATKAPTSEASETSPTGENIRTERQDEQPTGQDRNTLREHDGKNISAERQKVRIEIEARHLMHILELYHHDLINNSAQVQRHA